MPIPDTIFPSIADRFFRPVSASTFLAEQYGLPIAVPTLAKFRVIGGGPAFHRFGRLIVYRAQDLTDWAQARLSEKLSSTSHLQQRGK